MMHEKFLVYKQVLYGTLDSIIVPYFSISFKLYIAWTEHANKMLCII